MPTLGPGEVLVWSGMTDYNDGRSGTLYVTNRRLFLEYKKGILRKRDCVLAETPVDEIASVSIEDGPWNWKVLVVATSDERHRFMFRNERPDVLAGKISEVMAAHNPK